ncbi:MATE family efflux transporter [Kordiimonas aquimaris]|uniref:MATE family efflux transporter n=1 Tax=Kordiimonas aquimaris TaxID=707591 RepID=UPI0021CE9A85|nr:MATE family efflux transporter [Kordiimonas aquimaris]
MAEAPKPSAKNSTGTTSSTIDAPFTQGSVFRHVIVMTLTGAVGLMSVFAVDLMDMYFLSLLGEAELAAAIGFAGTILFFTASICIGLSIATGALTARAVGARDRAKTGCIVFNTMAFTVMVTFAVMLIIYPLLPNILTLIGANGRTHELALSYMHIILPTLPFMGLGMAAGGVLRALGDARRAMMVMVTAAVVNGILDPILIFGFELGLEGAAYASAAARIAMFAAGARAIFGVHGLRTRICVSDFVDTLRPMLKIAMPATITNVATPIGNAYVVALIAQYGDSVVAGNTIVARITPVAFALFFSMSGSIGPVIGQNLGAHKYDRVHETIASSLRFIAGYTVVLWAVFLLCQEMIVSTFSATGPSADMIRTFCIWVVPLTAFLGALFVANATFNNLGYPVRATIFNVTKATAGTVPFAIAGAAIDGPEGVLIGQAVGSMIVGIIAVYVCFNTIQKVADQANISRDEEVAEEDAKAATASTPMMPYSSARAFHASGVQCDTEAVDDPTADNTEGLNKKT